MTTEQKLREALQIASHHLDMAAFELSYPDEADLIRQALALPTTEQVDDINVAESFTNLLHSWEVSSIKSTPTDAMLINKHIRELRELVQRVDMQTWANKSKLEIINCPNCGDLAKSALPTTQAQEPIQTDKAALQMLVAGALFDFAGYLTTLPEPLAIGAAEFSGPMVEHLKKWAETRNLPLDEAAVMSWQDAIATQPQAQEFPDERAAFEALEKIAAWNSHDPMLGVDYGSNGVRDFYRKIARAALAAKPVPDDVRKDAERYRWLYQQNANLDAQSMVVLSHDTEDDNVMQYWVGADLSAAIDAAIAAQGGKCE